MEHAKNRHILNFTEVHILFFVYRPKGETKQTSVRNPLRLVEVIKTVLKPADPSTITNETEH